MTEKKTWKFWSTQPVIQLGKVHKEINESINPDQDTSEIKQEPYLLPDGFKWDTLNILNTIELSELYILLRDNYVEDSHAVFRFDYSKEFLEWALMPPGYLSQWHLAIRANISGKLLGFISAVPANININSIVKPMVEINYLCVHKKLSVLLFSF